jgi:hypothetical protein
MTIVYFYGKLIYIHMYFVVIFIFISKMPISVYFGRPWRGTKFMTVLYFMANWLNLWSFRIFFLLAFVVPRKKFGNPVPHSLSVHQILIGLEHRVLFLSVSDCVFLSCCDNGSYIISRFKKIFSPKEFGEK